MILLVIGTRRICLLWRTIPFLVFDMCDSTVFLKTELFFLVPLSLSRKRIPRCCSKHSAYYSRVLLSACWFSIRAGGVIFPDRPYWCLVSLIVSLIPRQPPTPSAIPTSLKQRSTSSARTLQLYEATHHRRVGCGVDFPFFLHIKHHNRRDNMSLQTLH